MGVAVMGGQVGGAAVALGGSEQGLRLVEGKVVEAVGGRKGLVGLGVAGVAVKIGAGFGDGEEVGADVGIGGVIGEGLEQGVAEADPLGEDLLPVLREAVAELPDHGGVEGLGGRDARDVEGPEQVVVGARGGHHVGVGQPLDDGRAGPVHLAVGVAAMETDAAVGAWLGPLDVPGGYRADHKRAVVVVHVEVLVATKAGRGGVVGHTERRRVRVVPKHRILQVVVREEALDKAPAAIRVFWRINGRVNQDCPDRGGFGWLRSITWDEVEEVTSVKDVGSPWGS